MTEEITYSMVFKNKDFVKLLTGQIFSNSGDAILQISILLYVYSFTGSLSITTGVLAVQMIPWIIVGPIAGVLADRISRKAIMLFADILRAIVIACVPFVNSVFGLGIIVFLIGFASSSFAAPRSAVIPEIVGLKLFVKAISLSQLIFQSLRIIGPLAAAYIYILMGLKTFYFASVFYMLSFIFILITNIPPPKQSEDNLNVLSVLKDLTSGFKYLFHEKVIRKILVLFAIIIMGSAFAGTLIYPFIFEIIHNGKLILEDKSQSEFGIIGASGAIGSIIGNLLFGKYEKSIGRQFAIISGSLAIGIYYAFFGIITLVIQIAILALVSGIFGGLLSLTINAIFAETVPNEIRGRAYSATNSYVMIISVIATSASGIIADLIGITSTIIIAGVLIVIFTLIMTISTKKFSFAAKSNMMNNKLY